MWPTFVYLSYHIQVIILYMCAPFYFQYVASQYPIRGFLSDRYLSVIEKETINRLTVKFFKVHC